MQPSEYVLKISSNREYTSTMSSPDRASSSNSLPTAFVRSRSMIILITQPNVIYNFVMIEENGERVSKNKVL